MFVFAIRVIGELLTKSSTRWLYDGSGERCQTSIDLTKDDGIINKFIALLYRFKVYRRYVFRTFTPVHDNYKLSPVLKRFLLIYTMAFLVFFIFVVLLLALFALTIGQVMVPLFWDGDKHLKTDSVISACSALGTCLAAIFAARSAKGVFLSNKNIEKNNKEEAFDSIYRVLIEQHSLYLKKIDDFLSSSPENIIFHIDYLSSRSLGEAVAILRGENTTFYLDNTRYEYKDGKIVAYENHLEISVTDDLAKEVKQKINAANHFAKNTLSPYMRILYHTLKVVSEHHAENTSDITLRAKQYTNIVRSVIPNDVLFLVAMNSACFLHHGVSSMSLHYNQPGTFFNDYYKYLLLLKRYDFLEHLLVKDISFSALLYSNAPRPSLVSMKKTIFRIKNNHNHGVFLSEGGYFIYVIASISDAFKKENALLCIYYFYEIGKRQREIERYFKNKYIKAFFSTFETVPETRFHCRLSRGMAYQKNDRGQLIYLSDNYIELIISGRLFI